MIATPTGMILLAILAQEAIGDERNPQKELAMKHPQSCNASVVRRRRVDTMMMRLGFLRSQEMQCDSHAPRLCFRNIRVPVGGTRGECATMDSAIAYFTSHLPQRYKPPARMAWSLSPCLGGAFPPWMTTSIIIDSKLCIYLRLMNPKTTVDQPICLRRKRHSILCLKMWGLVLVIQTDIAFHSS
jgi:hypothetical protein